MWINNRFQEKEIKVEKSTWKRTRKLRRKLQTRKEAEMWNKSIQKKKDIDAFILKKKIQTLEKTNIWIGKYNGKFQYSQKRISQNKLPFHLNLSEKNEKDI
jgi:hypothetical protein